MKSKPRAAVWPPVQKRHPVQHERKVQAEIVKFHCDNVIHPDQAVLFAVPNGEKRDKRTAGILAGRRARDLTQQYPGVDWNTARWSDGRNPQTEQDAYEAALRPYGQGVLPGAIDLTLLLPDALVILIEVKDPGVAGERRGGVMGKFQRWFQRAALGMGHTHVILETVQGYELLLRTYGVALKVPAATRPEPIVSLAP